MTARITLYGFGMSQNAVRPEIALREKGLEYERVEVNLMAGEHRKPPLSDLSPRGQVPTLVYDDGSGEPLVVYESIATIRFIDELQAEPPLMPPTSELRRRATAYMRIEEFQAKLDGKNVFGSVAFRKLTREQLGDRVDALLGELPRWDTYVREAGGHYLAGETFSLADIAVFPLLLHFEVLGYDYAKHTPALADYIARCKARKSVQDTGWMERFFAFAKAREVAPVLSDS